MARIDEQHSPSKMALALAGDLLALGDPISGPGEAADYAAEIDQWFRSLPIEVLWAELVRRSVAGDYPEGWPKVTLQMILDLEPLPQ